MSLLDNALAMGEQPTRYFSYSQTRMFSMPRADLEQLQLAALQHRLGTLRGRIPMLGKLADATGTKEILRIEDIAPLLFKHTIYKSYPSSFLSQNKFDAITKWIGKLTTHDVSRVDTRGCNGIDSWLSALDRQSDLRVCHSSGTSGTVSFLPMDGADYRRMISYWPLTFFQRFGDDSHYDGSPLNVTTVKFDYRRSYRSGGRVTDYVRDLIAGDEERFMTLYPGTMSSDLLYLAGKIRAAQAAGSLDTLEVSPALLARKAEFAALHANEKLMRENFFERLGPRIAGKQVLLFGYSGTVWQIMQAYRQSGTELRNLFAPGSIMISGGGGKGVDLPADWADQLKAFTGVERIIGTYAMAEVMAMNPQCEHDHYHFLPSVIPFVLDPETGESMPRQGRTTGRAAFFDIGTTTRWGGFISGDEITVEWDEPCPCGRQGAHIVGAVERYSAKQGGDDKINCAATPQAQEEALEFLLDL